MVSSITAPGVSFARAAAIAIAAGSCAYVGAFDLRAPAVLLVAPVVALAFSETRSARVGVSVLTHLALWAPLPGMAVAYGLSPLEAGLGIAMTMLSQALIVGLLPPGLGVGFWALSPVGFGHPIFGVFSVVPFGALGSVWGLVVAALIIFGLGTRRTCVTSLLCLGTLWAISTVHRDPPRPSAIVPISTTFGERSLFPADDWAEVSDKLVGVDGSGTRLLPEGTIGLDGERGQKFFSELARNQGHDLLIGVSGEDGERIVHFLEDGRIETLHRQVQGIPLVNDLPAMPWSFFLIKPSLVGGERVTFAICFEAFLPLTWLRAIVSRSTTIAVVSNERWNAQSVKNAQSKLLSFPWPSAIVAASNLPEK